MKGFCDYMNMIPEIILTCDHHRINMKNGYLNAGMVRLKPSSLMSCGRFYIRCAVVDRELSVDSGRPSPTHYTVVTITWNTHTTITNYVYLGINFIGETPDWRHVVPFNLYDMRHAFYATRHYSLAPQPQQDAIDEFLSDDSGFESSDSDYQLM